MEGGRKAGRPEGGPETGRLLCCRLSATHFGQSRRRVAAAHAARFRPVAGPLLLGQTPYMNILVAGPHPDDQELAMGGTIALLARRGHRVTLLDITDGEPTPHGLPEIRAAEAAAAAAALGVARQAAGLRNREVLYSLAGRHQLAAIYRQLRPDILFLPYPQDAHPDHGQVTRIAEDARFDAKLTRSTIPGEPFYPPRLIYYFCTHLRMNFPASFCVDVSATMEVKMQALRCYDSQFFRGRPAAEQGAVLDYVRNLDAYFGGTIRRPFAEPFYVTEMLGLSGLEEIVL